MAWVALKLGDRVGAATPSIRGRGCRAAWSSGARRLPASSSGWPPRSTTAREETNYTFALTTLAAKLQRRSMMVLFTEFADPISAELMLRERRGAWCDTHLVLFVVLRDEELEAIADAEPQSADDVTRAVTAAALLQGAARGASPGCGTSACTSSRASTTRSATRLVDAYLDLKRRELL